jgi:DNA invertase Pin-like site-specific DNA recombinase
VKVRCVELDPVAELTEVGLYASSVPAAVAEGRKIRHLIVAGAKLERSESARKQATKHRTKRHGRPPALKTEHKRREAVERCLERGATVTAVAGAMGVSQPTIYRAFQAAFGPDYHAKLAARRAAVAHARISL